MASVYFDTLEAATKLKASDFSEQQAVAWVHLLKQTVETVIGQIKHAYHLEDVATKRDLKELEAGLKHDIELLRADTKRDIAETKADLIRWVVGVGLLQITIISALLLKIANHFNA